MSFNYSLNSRLINCRDCGHEISKNAPTCPACGAPNYEFRRKKMIGALIGGLVSLLILWAIISLGIMSMKRMRDRSIEAIQMHQH